MSQSLKPLHYFAYGSNMNPARVDQRKLETVGEPIAGVLRNYELKFNKISRRRKGTASANIVPSFGASVKGVMYELSESLAIESMDRFENAPADYAREVVLVHVQPSESDQRHDRVVAAWTYIAKPHAMSDEVKPTREYMGHLLASPFLNAEEHSQLQAIECFDD